MFLESLGYKNYWKDLNAKNYGIPQNRDRCYMISLLNSNCDYTFPQPIKLKLRLKDMLEEKVDEKYFLSKSILKFFSENSEKNKLKGNGFRFKPVNKNKAEIAKTLTTRCGSRMDDNFIVDDEKVTRLGGFFDKNGIKHQAGSVYDINGLSPIIDTMQGGYRQPCIVVKNDLRIRKLTPKECWRLMGFSDDDFDKAEKINSNTQLYKQAGNSIVVNVLMAIFKQFFN